MKEKTLTPEQSFDLINKAIANFKMNYKESANTFLLWGWMMTLACFSHYIIFKILHSQEAYNLLGLFSIGNWAVFVFITFIIQFIMQRKLKKDKKVYSYLDSYLKKLWTVAGASMFVATYICIKLEIVPPTLILLIAGIATTITGLLIKFKPLIFGGIAFFIFSIATTLVTNDILFLVTGASVICGYLIPGYLLKAAKE